MLWQLQHVDLPGLGKLAARVRETCGSPPWAWTSKRLDLSLSSRLSFGATAMMGVLGRPGRADRA